MLIPVAVVAAALLGAFLWIVLDRTASSVQGPTSVKPIEPVGLSASGLQTLAGVVGQPIYWAGARPGYLYELTRTSTGNVFIRYLPPGKNVGAKGAGFLVIGTYPYVNALGALEQTANGGQIALAGGGIAVVDQQHPTSVRLAFPGVDYQVEVYDPSPARSLQLARSGAVRPVH